MLLTTKTAPTQATKYFSAQTLQRTYNRVATAQAALEIDDPTRDKKAERLSKGWLLFFAGDVLDSAVADHYYVRGSKGAVYAVTPCSCECGDAEHRGVECKHVVAVRCLRYARAAELVKQSAELEAQRLATLAKNRRLTLVRQEKTASA